MAEPNGAKSMKVGIVGAGISGLACASRLAENGIGVALYDKGKRPGGRLSTLQLDCRTWDFGAQFIEQGQGAFALQIANWRQAGVIEPWPEGPSGALVGVPTMARLVTEMAAHHDVRFTTQVTRLARTGGGWQLGGPGLDDGPFDALVLAIPAEQAAPLLSLHDLSMAREAAAIRSRACWTVMAAFSERVSAPDVVADCPPLALAARDSSKPGRADSECWVIQADAAWTAAHLERDAGWVAEALLEAFADQCAAPLPPHTFLKAHRWRFAAPHGHAAGPLWNAQLRLGACGDWCAAPDVGGAWNAGTELAERMIGNWASVKAAEAVLAK